jgi:predicted negative regulator of RcsB-dependent stress response
MREDLEQQEQFDAIKGFWNDNKRWIVPVLSIIAVSAISFNGWLWWQDRQASKATDALAAMEQALVEQSVEKAKVAFKVLAEDYSGTTQAALGGLQMAKVFVSEGSLPEARAALEVVSKSPVEEFAWIAKIRLAGVLLDENNAQAAVAVLAGQPPAEFLGLVNDRRGDVHAALGQKEEARKAWRVALDGIGAEAASRELIARKLATVDSFGSKP